MKVTSRGRISDNVSTQPEGCISSGKSAVPPPNSLSTQPEGCISSGKSAVPPPNSLSKVEANFLQLLTASGSLDSAGDDTLRKGNNETSDSTFKDSNSGSKLDLSVLSSCFRDSSLTEAENAFINEYYNSLGHGDDIETCGDVEEISVEKLPKWKKESVCSLADARKKLCVAINFREDYFTSKENYFLRNISRMSNISVENLRRAYNVLQKGKLCWRYRDEHIQVERMISDKMLMVGVDSFASQADTKKSKAFVLRREVWKEMGYLSLYQKSEHEFVQVLRRRSVDLAASIDSRVDVNVTPNFFFCSALEHFYPKKKVAHKETKPKPSTHDTPKVLTQPVIGLRSLSYRPVLSPAMMDKFRSHLPFSIQADNFWLKYSSLRDGFSIDKILFQLKHSHKNILAIETRDGDIFGAYTNSRWHTDKKKYYGSCDSFLWNMLRNPYDGDCETVNDQILLESEVEVYPWTGKNRKIQLSNSSVIAVGGSKNITGLSENHVGISINKDQSGCTNSCQTFGNPSFAEFNKFEIENVELWTLTAATSVEESEALELSRSYIFEYKEFIV